MWETVVTGAGCVRMMNGEIVAVRDEGAYGQELEETGLMQSLPDTSPRAPE